LSQPILWDNSVRHDRSVHAADERFQISAVWEGACAHPVVCCVVLSFSVRLVSWAPMVLLVGSNAEIAGSFVAWGNSCACLPDHCETGFPLQKLKILHYTTLCLVV